MLSTARAPEALPLIRCEAGGGTYAMDVSWVRSIQRSDHLKRSEKADGQVGWVPGPKKRVPVFDLPARLGSPLRAATASGPIIVLDADPEPWGLQVDRVARLGVVAAADVLPLPAIADDPARGCYAGVVRRNGELLLYLSPERLHPQAETRSEPSAINGDAEPKPAAGEGAPPTPAHGPGRVVLFSTSPAGSPVFALSLTQIKEISLPRPLIRVPGSPAYLLGLTAWRRQAVPVVDLSLRLGAGASFFEGESRMLFARGARVPKLVAFPVRPDIHAETLPLPDRSSAGETPLDPSLVRGAFEFEENPLIVPDLDRLLTLR